MDRMDAHTQAFISDMRTQRGDLQQIGRGLQAGMKAMAGELIMAAPRAGTNKLRGSVDCVGPAGEDKTIRGTCRMRHVEVTTTETLTVTEREKLNGETDMCKTRHEVTTT